MLRARKTKFSQEEYLAMEEVAQYKSEFHRGEIFAVSGGTYNHSVIQGNLVRQLGNLLDSKPCTVVTADLRIHIEAGDLFTYPDAAVVCGKARFFPRRTDTIVNPSLIIEVLSPSTRDYDRGAKFEMYKHIQSLQEYVLVEGEKAHVECFRRRAGGWTLAAFSGMDASCRLESLDCEIPLSRIYQKVTWLE